MDRSMYMLRTVIICLLSAVALSGCMGRSGPVATIQPQSDLDSIAYGQATSSEAAAYAQEAGTARPGLFTSPAGRFNWPRRSYASVTAAEPVAAVYAEPAPVVYAAATPAPAAAYAAVAIPVAYDTAYRLDAGDKLRIVVYGQEGLTNTYAIGASGSITMPLIGSVPARGKTPTGLAADITAKLRGGFIRDPSVAVEIESYRPFFILGEVAAPGQYPYVPNLSVESAVAIAGGFSPRARRDIVTLTHTDGAGLLRTVVPLGTPVSPGDTVLVSERWF